MSAPDTTRSDREREAQALALFLAGTLDALEVVPESSEWRRTLVTTKHVLKAQLALHDAEGE